VACCGDPAARLALRHDGMKSLNDRQQRWNAAMRAKTAWMHPKATWEEDRSSRCGIGVARTTSSGIPQPVLATRGVPLLALN
jgi:hypothetical protein